MSQVQSVLALLILLVVCFSPWIVARSRGTLPLPPVLSGEEAAARHLYGEFHGWDDAAMREFDWYPHIRAPWLREAKEKINGHAS